MDSRDILIGHINDGIDTTQIGDNSNKSILVRGCDPEMGRRAIKLLPPVLGNPEMVSITNDDDFITELQRKKWSVIFFAPGACRYDARTLPIPGSRSQTKGWGLKEYRNLVRKHQGEDINIAFNPTYLTDGLTAINTAFVHISFTGANKPAVLTGQTEAGSAPITNYKYLLMPMRYSS